MHKQILTSVVLLPFLFACFEDEPGAELGGTETAGDGDGDPTGDGDGDPTGDGDGDPTGDGDGDPTGDGDGDPTTTGDGDGDGDPTTTGDGDGDGDPVAECGNGIVEADEVCDNGNGNALEPDACAPDCSTIIETKVIKFSSALSGPDFQPNPLAYADSRCEAGYKAMFAFGNQRVATTVAWQSVNPVDWPIEPYTAYVNTEDVLLWVTDDVRLLAVRDGAHQEPLAPLVECNGNFTCLFNTSHLLSGLNSDGTSSVSDTCNGWSTFADGFNYSEGSVMTFEYSTNVAGCANYDPDGLIFANVARFLCIEQ